MTMTIIIVIKIKLEKTVPTQVLDSAWQAGFLEEQSKSDKHSEIFSFIS